MNAENRTEAKRMSQETQFRLRSLKMLCVELCVKLDPPCAKTPRYEHRIFNLRTCKCDPLVYTRSPNIWGRHDRRHP